MFHAADGVALGGLTPTAAADAYNIAALHSAGFLGQGMKIAIVSFSDYDHGDPSAFDQRYGLGGPAPQVIDVDGGADSDGGADEANLDIDVVKMIAPDAQILFYEAPGSASSYPDMINRIVADHQASIITSSWGSCERETDPSVVSANEQALKAAAAAGISMFVASGDSGAYDCQRSDLADHRLTVDSPAASAYAVAVGGTRLNMSPSGAYESESGWDDPLSNAGGGGGYTTADARPTWQSGPGVSTSLNKRGVPDVSADADQSTGWSTYNGGHWGQAGGTSAATPFWAASMLLIQQYATSHHAGRIGFVDPILYALAKGGQPYTPFHDVTAGSNRYYPARPGWDPATGLGSPNVYDLARDMLTYLQHHPGGLSRQYAGDASSNTSRGDRAPASARDRSRVRGFSAGRLQQRRPSTDHLHDDGLAGGSGARPRNPDHGRQGNRIQAARHGDARRAADGQKGVITQIQGVAGQPLPMQITVVDGDINSFWGGLFNKAGLQWPAMRQSLIPSGMASAPNCQGDTTIAATDPWRLCDSPSGGTFYFPLTWVGQHVATDSSGVNLLLGTAELWSNHVENLLGVTRAAENGQLTPADYAEIDVCLTGVYAYSVNGRQLFQAGDQQTFQDWYQRMSPEFTDVSAKDVSTQQLQQAFAAGLNSGSPSSLPAVQGRRCRRRNHLAHRTQTRPSGGGTGTVPLGGLSTSGG